MKVIFFGSSEFSVAFLEAVFKSDHEITAVVTNADKESGRGKRLLPNPVKLKALQLNLKTIEIKKMDEDICRKLLNLTFDCLVVVSFGHIIPEKIIHLSDNRAINVHPSLLPKYRGPSPVTSALINGDNETGVTIMRINENLDMGDIFAQVKFKISISDNKDRLESKLTQIGAPLLVGVLNLIGLNMIESFPQTGEPSYTKIFNSSDMKIDWSLKSAEILNRIRAFSYEPGAFTIFNNHRIKILDAIEYDCKDEDTIRLISDKNYDGGAVIKADKNSGLVVKCKDEKALKIIELKVEGKSRISSHDFLNGYKIKPGDYFN
ncbi:methionyl-tRNA formyltransferase [bacterium]|nr:methionyl-tRNA formyltransferase [bacterium]